MIAYADLIGKAYRLHAEGPDAYDCSTVAAEILRRGGFQYADLSTHRISGQPVGILGYLDDNAKRFQRVGDFITDATEDGDLVLTADGCRVNEQGLFVMADARHRLFLTAVPKSGVIAVGQTALRRLRPKVLGVYRLAQRSAT